ncbi:MAG: hypothetical protein HY744_16845 [Deltaproteobacteria bacterium]|nr:hypothetical protein [Deltaproteobacteria bacterium]
MTARAVITARLPDTAGSPVVLARGGSDAHLRLAVLLAARAAPEGADRDAALAPGTPWRARCAALIRATGDGDAAPAVIVDPDAAWTPAPTGGAAFDDCTSARERASFFATLLEVGAKRGWIFVRVAPRPEVTDAMAGRGIDSEVATGEATDIPELAPALQPLAQWLVTQRRVDARHLRRLLADADDPQDALVAAFEDVVGPTARGVLRRLALLREEHPIDGGAGPFRTRGRGALAIPAHALATLRQSGALAEMRGAGHARFAMHAVLRDRLARRQAAVEPRWRCRRRGAAPRGRHMWPRSPG